MEPTHLDALARALSRADLTSSRRALVSGLAGGVAGLTGLSLLGQPRSGPPDAVRREALSD